MSDGSSLATAKSRLEAVLEARAGLAGVPVTDGGPVSARDLQNDSGAYEAIWFGDSRTVQIEVPHTGLPVELDETYELDVVIQVLKRAEAADTQAAATARSVALLGEVIGALAADPSLGYTPTVALPILEALPQTWEHKGGWLGKGDEHGSRFVLKVRIFSRLHIT